MKVLFVTSEAVPFSKTGGLADVSHALPLALIEAGIDVRIITTKSFEENINYTNPQLLKEFNVQLGWRNQYCGLIKVVHNKIPYYFIDNEYYFKRNQLYGEYDDGERFLFFSSAVLESINYMDDFIPDIIHMNDWHSGAISILLKENYYKNLENVKTIFTIHNLRFQGIFDKFLLTDMLGISENQFSDGTLEFYGNINLMKGAINNSDIVTTVSPTYSREIMTDFFGENLHNVLKSNEYKVFGILNGIDQKIYNPQNDSFINSNYDISSINKKFENKRFIQEKLSLETNPSAPVISMISRFDEMKGFDLIIKVFDELMDENIQMIILGVGESKYENFFKSRQDRYKGKFSLNTVFDEALAHEIYAGSDMFLMPSKFEPCGLSQQISMAYGTVPIVRETGGLKDTVTHYNKYDETGNGFSFGSYNAHEMLFAIKRALEIYPVKDKWQKIVESAMNFNSSWKVSANKYIELYNKLLEKSDDY